MKQRIRGKQRKCTDELEKGPITKRQKRTRKKWKREKRQFDVTGQGNQK